VLAPRLEWSAADLARAMSDYETEVQRLFTIEP
jgi:hypothetical protein